MNRCVLVVGSYCKPYFVAHEIGIINLEIIVKNREIFEVVSENYFCLCGVYIPIALGNYYITDAIHSNISSPGIAKTIGRIAIGRSLVPTSASIARAKNSSRTYGNSVVLHEINIRELL